MEVDLGVFSRVKLTGTLSPLGAFPLAWLLGGSFSVCQTMGQSSVWQRNEHLSHRAVALFVCLSIWWGGKKGVEVAVERARQAGRGSAAAAILPGGRL